MKTIIGLAALIAFVTPALAADTFYLVQDTTTKRCSVVEQRPSTTTTIKIVGDEDAAYNSRVDAETAMNNVKICASDNTGLKPTTTR